MKTSLKKEENVLVLQKKKTRVVVPKKAKEIVVKTKKALVRKTDTKLIKKPSVTKIKSVKTKVNKVDTEEVFIPSTASLRLLEKIEIYKLWYRDSLSTYMANTAKVGGYAFIVLGAIFASLSLLANKHGEQLAAIVCTENVCTNIDDASLAPGSPLVTFINSLPVELKRDTDIVIKTENAQNFNVYLKSIATNQNTELTPTENLPNNEYRYLLPIDSIPSGEYIMMAEVKDFSKVYKFKGPVFSVVEEDNQEPEIEPDTKEIEDEIGTSTDEVVTDSLLSDEIADDSNDNSATSTEEVTDKQISLEELSIDAVSNNSNSPINLILKNISNFDYLNIDANEILSDRVEVYARIKDSSSQLIYLGLATKVQGEWIFNLSALDLPTVDLLLTANLVTNNSSYQTEGIFYPSKANVLATTTADLDGSILSQKIILSLEDSQIDLNSRLKYLDGALNASSSTFDINSEYQFAGEEISDLATEVMDTNRNAINSILTNYASAVGVGSTFLINLVDEQIIKQIKLFATQAASSISKPESSPMIETVLGLRYQILKEQIKLQEEEINKVTSSLTTKDTDLDGFSDFDEIAIYSSNPQVADTDNDSVIDSVEIITNSNPLVVDIYDFTNIGKSFNKNVNEELVSIKAIEPIVVKDVDGKESILALVSGKGIPNSYVTILSYTNNLSGVIKTNDVGDFAYTIEANLEDDEYQVRAVIADNNGNLIAGSKIYNFTKKSTDFIASAIATEQVQFESIEDNKSLILSTVIAAVGVVAFGFVLLMLAQTIRNKKTTLAKS